MKKEAHPHAAALDRIGRSRVVSHFNITQGAYSNWKARGVPRLHLRSLAHLAVIHGVSVPELGQGGL
jgi:hypothetical protein